MVCGLVGRDREWKRVSRSLRCLNKRFGVRRLHAVELFSGSEDFKGWDWTKRRDYLDRLLKILERRQLHLIGAVVEVDALQEFDIDDRRLLTGAAVTRRGTKVRGGSPERPFFAAFHWSIYLAAKHATPDVEKVDYIFHRQAQFEPLARDQFDLYEKARHPDLVGRLGSLSFESDLEATPLQVADLSAYLHLRMATAKLDDLQEATLHRLQQLKRFDASDVGVLHLNREGLGLVLESIQSFTTVLGIAEWAAKMPQIRRVFLFGSRVKGTHGPESDLGVAVEVMSIRDQPLEMEADSKSVFAEESSSWEAELGELVPFPVDLECYDPEGGTPKIDQALKDASIQVYGPPLPL